MLEAVHFLSELEVHVYLINTFQILYRIFLSSLLFIRHLTMPYEYISYSAPNKAFLGLGLSHISPTILVILVNASVN